MRQPALPPDAQVVKETSMAETQRKQAYDQARIQLDTQKAQDDMAKHTQDNQTKIAIENAKLTHETIKQIATAQQPAVEPAPQPEGEPNGNI
jgi:hypothetical protein